MCPGRGLACWSGKHNLKVGHRMAFLSPQWVPWSSFHKLDKLCRISTEREVMVDNQFLASLFIVVDFILSSHLKTQGEKWFSLQDGTCESFSLVCNEGALILGREEQGLICLVSSVGVFPRRQAALLCRGRSRSFSGSVILIRKGGWHECREDCRKWCFKHRRRFRWDFPFLRD